MDAKIMAKAQLIIGIIIMIAAIFGGFHAYKSTEDQAAKLTNFLSESTQLLGEQYELSPSDKQIMLYQTTLYVSQYSMHLKTTLSLSILMVLVGLSLSLQGTYNLLETQKV